MDRPTEGRFGEDVRIVLAAADFSPEVTSTVLWLNQRDLDFARVRIQPYQLGASILLDVQQIIPLPEAADYQVQIRQKQREVRAAAEQATDWTRYDVQAASELHRTLYKREVMFVVCRFLWAKESLLKKLRARPEDTCLSPPRARWTGLRFVQSLQRGGPMIRKPQRDFSVAMISSSYAPARHMRLPTSGVKTRWKLQWLCCLRNLVQRVCPIMCLIVRQRGPNGTALAGQAGRQCDTKGI
jgi:hypothetical protein